MCCIYFKGTKITLDLGTVGTPILTIMHNEALPVAKFSACGRKINHSVTGTPRLARPPRPGPCLDFGFQYTLIRNNWLKKNGGRILGLAWHKFAAATLA